MLDLITQEDPALFSPECLHMALMIVSRMEATFVQRRGIKFFHFLFTHLSYPTRHPYAIHPFFHEVAFPFQNKKVLGLCIQLGGIYGKVKSCKRSFLDRHKDLLLVKDATLGYIDYNHNCTQLYFEVQKGEGDFSPDEIDDCVESLEELVACLTSQRKTPIPSSEGSFKMLRYIMSEINEGDLPHAFIELSEETADTLTFTACLSWMKAGGSERFSALLARPEISEKARVIETDKEGMIARIELTHSPISSLVEGRKRVCALIEDVVGPFRDGNGGLLEQIEANFQALAPLIPGSNGKLRHFFDGIYPEETRATFPPALLCQVYLAFQKMREEGVQALKFMEEERWIAAIVPGEKGQKKAWETTLAQSLPNVSFSHLEDAHQLILGAFALTSQDEERQAFKRETRALVTQWKQQQTSPHVLRLCTTARFTSFDPRTGTEEETSYLHKMLFEGLMRIGKEGKPELAIAKHVSISEDGKSYRFLLRKSKWSNGMDLTAHDFLYSWQMVLTRKDLAPLSYLFDCIEHAQAIKEKGMPIDNLGVTLVDDYTLDIKLLSPCTSFLEICALTLFSPICQAVDQKYPSWSEAEGEEYVCNGPFCLKKKEASGGVILKKNIYYWKEEKVKLEKVTIPLVSQEEGRELFLNKKLDDLLYFF